MPENDEGKNDVEDKELLDEKGNPPESVTWQQYVGTKESLGKKLDTAKGQITSLEDKLKNAVTQEDYAKIKTELEDAQTKLQAAETRLQASVEEKRNILRKQGGFTDEQLSTMSEDAINGAMMVLERKSKLDLGTGSGGGTSLKGTPQQLTRQAYS